MFIKRKVRFLLHKRKINNVKNVSIRMRVTIKGQKPIDLPTGAKVDIDDWDTQTEYAKIKAVNATEINRIIDDYKVKINEIFARYELLEKRVPTSQEVKTLFYEMTGKTPINNQKEPDFWQTFNLFITQEGKNSQWAPSTYKKFFEVKKRLFEFNPDLSFSTLTENTLYSFIDFFNKKKYQNTTRQTHLAFLLWFIRWAARHDYYLGKAHQIFKPKLKGVTPDSKEIIYLTKVEIQQLQEFVFTEKQKSLEQVRDVFLFQCFTGLRYSDLEKLKRIDIKNNVIHVVTKKTQANLQIELNKFSKQILDKYKDTQFADNRPLPITSIRCMNEQLKKIGELVGLNEMVRVVYFQGEMRKEKILPKYALLTTHVARRTFVVTALLLGIPAEVIMRWTGHSDFDAMKPYVKIVDELKVQSMSKFDLL